MILIGQFLTIWLDSNNFFSTNIFTNQTKDKKNYDVLLFLTIFFSRIANTSVAPK